MEENNGWREFTFKDSGRTVQIRKVSFLLLPELRRAYEKQNPPPEPPLQEVRYGDRTEQEANLADPDYARRLSAYNDKSRQVVEEQARHLYTQRGVQCVVDVPAVTELREQMKILGTELDPDDKFVYVWHICIGSPEDYDEFTDALLRRNQPTAEAVQENLNSFRH